MCGVVSLYTRAKWCRPRRADCCILGLKYMVRMSGRRRRWCLARPSKMNWFARDTTSVVFRGSSFSRYLARFLVPISMFATLSS